MKASNTEDSYDQAFSSWSVKKIAVVGPGIVGMPMAALLAYAGVCEGSDRPAEVVVVQRNSQTSGWKVDSINSGRSPIGGVEPDLDRIVSESVASGRLRASHSYKEVQDADIILVCVQTDKKGFGPDYGPLFEALSEIGESLQSKPAGKTPLIVFESTLSPSSMTTLIKDHFAKYGLQEGRDILLGNSPNRVMPGRLVERVAASDKLVAGLRAITPKLIQRIYSRIVTSGKLYATNSLTAEVVKTFENAYRDVRIAYAAEIVRYCDEHDIDFYEVRREANARLALGDDASYDSSVIPSGGVLIPTIGVGGHCLPKDGILLWWRKLESNEDTGASLILESRRINDEAPAEATRLAERTFGELSRKPIALLGAAYRFDSEDTRNSPTFSLARHLMSMGCSVSIHDPYVKPTDQNLIRFGLQSNFTRDIEKALASAEYVFCCVSHRVYAENLNHIIKISPNLRGFFDGCNLIKRTDFPAPSVAYEGIGRGAMSPPHDFLDFVCDGFRIMERGVANELLGLVNFYNRKYAKDDFNKIDFQEVRRLAGTCVTGCSIAEPGPIESVFAYEGFTPRLVQQARNANFQLTSEERPAGVSQMPR